MLGFNKAYFSGKEAADKETQKHDSNPNPLGYEGHSLEDLNLGYKASEMGQNLRTGVLSKVNVSDSLFSNLKSANIKKLPQDTIVKLGEYIKKFRIFEYEQNGNILWAWQTAAEIGSISCGNSTLYYQDYVYFKYNNIYEDPARAVWNDQAKKIILLYGQLYNQYKTDSSLCSNISKLTSDYGYSLHFTFNEVVSRLKNKLNDKPVFN